MRSRSALSPLSIILLLTILSTTIILPLLFIVLPAVFAHLFLVRSRAQALQDPLLPFRPSAPLSLRSPPV